MLNFHVRLFSSNFLVVVMAVQIMSSLMSLNFSNITNLRNFTYQHVLARLYNAFYFFVIVEFICFLTFVYPFLSLAFPKGYCPRCGRFPSYGVQASWNRWTTVTLFSFFGVPVHIILSFTLEIFITGTKLSEDSRKYGIENTCTSGSTLSKAALSFARARSQMEKEHGNLLKALGSKVLIWCYCDTPKLKCAFSEYVWIRNIMPAGFSPNCWKLCSWICSTTFCVIIAKSKLINVIENFSFLWNSYWGSCKQIHFIMAMVALLHCSHYVTFCYPNLSYDEYICSWCCHFLSK